MYGIHTYGTVTQRLVRGLGIIGGERHHRLIVIYFYGGILPWEEEGRTKGGVLEDDDHRLSTYKCGQEKRPSSRFDVKDVLWTKQEV